MHWYDWLLLFLAAAGHITLVRVAFNYTFFLHLSESLWLGLVALTALFALAGPALIFWFPGAALLRNQSWSAVHPLWTIYLATCAAAPVIGVFVLARRKARQIPPSLLSHHAETLDTCSTLHHRPTGHGQRAWVARLPWNELFQVEFTEKQIRLPRLPKAWDGLSLLHLTDVHFHGTPEREFYECVFTKCQQWNPDLIAFTGDLLDDTAMADWLPTTLGALHAPFGRYFILGNHDTRTDAERSRALTIQLGWESVGSTLLHRTIRGLPLAVLGVERPWIGRYPTEELEQTPADTFRLLLTHGPHSFSWAKRNRVDLVLAGHLHGGQIRLPLLGPVTGGKYASGLFDEPPSLMHVGRGLGQLTPLRYACKPEVTKLILRAS